MGRGGVPVNTPEYIATQYGQAGHLNARIALHDRYSTNPYGWFRWVFDRVGLQPGCTCLEVGCGTGQLWRENCDRVPDNCTAILTDNSAGMLREAQQKLAGSWPGFHFLSTPAQVLPFRSGSVDVVIANHMLYHVPDLPATLAELHRVLRPGGRFFASTIGRNHLAELPELVHQFDPFSVYETARYAALFGLENGAGLLAPFFDAVSVDEYEDALEVTEAAPLAEYVGSLTREGMAFPPARLAAFSRFVANEIARRGPVHIRKATGMFSARRA